MGAGAIFYLYVALDLYFNDDAAYTVLTSHFKPIVYAVTAASILVHGMSIPALLAAESAWFHANPSRPNRNQIQ